MASSNFFPKRSESKPMIYAYRDTNPRYDGLLKIGYTAHDVDHRVAQQYPTLRPGGQPYDIVFREPAIRPDGSTFTDHDIHRRLRKSGVFNPEGEWFQCNIKTLKAAYISVRDNSDNIENRTQDFGMRPEQEDAVLKTIEYYDSERSAFPGRAPKFLWNAKMRFGKTFATYQLAKKMGLKKILVLTFKPAVESAWDEDLMTHVDFEGWQFISRNSESTFDNVDFRRPVVCFGSFQDFLGTNENGGIKAKNEKVHEINWDLVIFDEYHFGAWRENAKKLFDREDEDAFDSFDPEKYQEEEAGNAINETFLPITTNHYLFLSGTPFRAINSGEFIEDQIYNWTYSDEQKAKTEWGNTQDNPYAALPRMVLMTYKLPDEITRIAKQGEFDEFDLNIFFSAKGSGDEAIFVYEDYVQKWLDLIRGAYLPTTTDDLKLGGKRPPMPYSHAELLSTITHSLWFLPNVASCYAMANLLKTRQNNFYHQYNIHVAAGYKAGIGLSALPPVLKAMSNPLETKTITLSCGKLTTGVTIKPWAGIFMLRNLSSPETYFQAAFRVQSPWVIDSDGGYKEIIKKECYVFDFALDRALKQISDYSCRLNVNDSNPEKKVEEFIRFLPVLAYDGSSMRQIDASEVLDIAMAGTSATLLAKRWESALLVNVDNDTLSRLMSNKAAMDALMRIEGFRSLNSDIETIINKSESVKKAKKENQDKLTPKEKKELTEEEKEYKSMRKQIQEKLIKFATRIPIFMYLTDYREYSLKDVITQLEPGLFKKVTGLEVKDFELLVSLGVFNGPLMNDAVYKFKRYEDSSLSYTGINRHADDRNVGYWDTVVSQEDHMARILQQSMQPPEYSDDDIPDFDEALNYTDEDEESEFKGIEITKDIDHTNEKIFVPSSRQNDDRLPHSNSGRNSHKSISSSPFYDIGLKVADSSPKSVESNHMVNKEIEKKVFVGSILKHKKFGNGEVLSINNGIMLLRFDLGEKKFEHPGAIINGFLSLED